MPTGPEAAAAAFDDVVTGRTDTDLTRVHADLRAHAPVHHSERMGAHVVARYEDVDRVLRDEDRFRPLTGGRGTPLFGRTILQMQGREHSAKSSIIARRIRAPKALRGLRDQVDAVSARFADQLPADTSVDLREAYTMWLPLTVITDLLAVEEGVQWRRWYDLMAAGGTSSITGDQAARDRGIAARDELFDFVRPVMEARRADPGEDLLSALLTSEFDGQRLTEEEILSFTAFLLTAGVETTDRVLSSLLRHLALTPELWARVRADRDLVLPLCAEALRIFPPVQGVTRELAEPAVVGGVPLEPGDRLLLLLGSANRDDTVFEDPDTFDVTRFADDAARQFTGASRVLSFGGGRHHCTGSALAGLEMEIAVRDLLDRFETMEPAGPMPPAEGFILRSPPSVPVELTRA